MKISGITKLGMVVGSPISGSLSPIIQNAAIDALGLDAVFIPAEIKREHFKNFLAFLSDVNLFGVSVTMPLKQVAAENLKLTPIAQRLNAVNAIYRQDGELVGDNTDGEGFVEALKYKFDFNPRGKSVFILGAGGASKAIVLALSNEGCDRIIVHNRSEDKVMPLIEITDHKASPGQMSDAEDCDLIVNSTPVGMNNTETSGIDPMESINFKEGQIVFEIITSPTHTKLLTHASSQGAKIVEGYYMLTFQATAAFKKFSNQDAPVEIMLHALSEHLGTKS